VNRKAATAIQTNTYLIRTRGEVFPRGEAMRMGCRTAVRLMAFLTLGTLVVSAFASDPSTVRLPNGSELADVDFDRHVASLFGRLGCNAGSCHGSFQGRGGLNLSLFGYDAAHDYNAVTREAMGRRIDRFDPDRSLVLLKPSGIIPHEGGQRFTPGSWEYRTIRAWIAHGATRDPSRASVERIEVRPRQVAFSRPGESAPLAVIARFSDGADADVTPFCDIRAKDDATAEILPSGEVRGLRPGDTAIIASYRGLLASTRVSVPTGKKVGVPDVSECDFIDREVFAKLRALGIAPSENSSDTEFLRRVTLDVTGTLPSPDEIRAFLADRSSDKHVKKIELLLADPMHAALWATRFLDITGCDIDSMESPADIRPPLATLWHSWFRARVAENRPYDQIAKDVLGATSRDGRDMAGWLSDETARMLAIKNGKAPKDALKPALDLFWRRFANDEYFPIEQMAERTATAFLGVRIDCAQCHKHPFDRWTQADYRSYANIFSKVRFGHSDEGLAATARLLEELRAADPTGTLAPIPRLREVYVADRPARRLTDPMTGQPLDPKALGGPTIPIDGDPRSRLVAWLTQADNPYFARAFANRVWAVYFGVGLVDPVDGFSVANPPSNERLLDALAADFVAHGYDIRHLERTVLRSRAYQRSATPTDGNLDDRGNFARAIPRKLMAEVLVDALDAALGVTGSFGPDAPKGSRAIEIAANRLESPDLARVFRIFGRPRRKSTCDCERPRDPAVPQTLFLMTDSALLENIAKGRLGRLLESGHDDETIVAELFLATVSRYPSDDERRWARDHIHSKADCKAALGEVLWALINTREFVLNH
jgi:hypothetical protein